MGSEKINNEKNIFRTWVLDPNNKNWKKNRALIDSLLSNAPEVFQLIRTDSLENGLEAYKYIITKPEDQAYYALTQILSDISYDPLIISLALDESLKYDDMSEINEIIKETVKSVTNVQVSFNQIERYNDKIDFMPYDMNSNRIYTDYEKVGQILQEINEKVMLYIIKDENNVSKYEGVEGNTELEVMKIIRKNFNNKNNYVLESECLNNSPELTISLYNEICLLWGFNIIDRDFNKLIINRSEHNPIGKDWDVKDWFKAAKRSINLGNLIPVTLEGHWQLWGENKKVLISYAAYRAYIEDNYAFLSSLRVNNDYSVTADFDSLQTYIKFKSKFMYYLNKSEDYSILKTNNFVDAVIKRYELGVNLDEHNNGKTLIISKGNDSNNEQFYLVSELDIDNYVFIGMREEFTSELRVFLTRCSDIFVSTTETANVNSLSLEEMLEIIYSGNDIQSPCFSTNVVGEVKDMNLPLEPLLSNDENISRFENIDYALRGYFDFGPIKGVYSKPPTREIRIPIGRVEATIIEGSEDSFSAVPIVSADFVSPKGRRNLFRIATINVFEVQELAEILWSSGWFLSDWGISYYEKTGELSLSLIRNIHFLRIATDTPERGSDALELLKRVIYSSSGKDIPMDKLTN